MSALSLFFLALIVLVGILVIGFSVLVISRLFNH